MWQQPRGQSHCRLSRERWGRWNENTFLVKGSTIADISHGGRHKFKAGIHPSNLKSHFQEGGNSCDKCVINVWCFLLVPDPLRNSSESFARLSFILGYISIEIWNQWPYYFFLNKTFHNASLKNWVNL